MIGVPAALAAALFLALVHDLEHWLWSDLPDPLGHSSPPWYLVVGVPLAGACVVLVARRFLPGDGGVSPLVGLGGEKPPPISHGPGIALAAVGTLSFGAVLGPEMPLIALGMVVGLLVTPILRLGERESSLLAAAGAFSAISALFGGPIVGGVIMVESGAAGLGASLAPALLPGFVVAATGDVVFIGFGGWGGLGTPGLAEPGLPLRGSLCRQPRVRVPRRPDLPGDLPRNRGDRAARGLVRHLTDGRGRDRGCRRNGRDDSPLADADALRSAPRRPPGGRHRSDRGARRLRGVARDARDRPARARVDRDDLIDDRELARRRVQAPAAVLGHRDDVLDPDAELVGKVDPRLDREAHAGLEQLFLALHHVRRLVRGQADAVPGPMDEPLAVARLRDHLARGPVDVLTRDARPNGFEPGLLRLLDDLVHLALRVGRLADVHGARRVRRVAVHDSAEVENDH